KPRRAIGIALPPSLNRRSKPTTRSSGGLARGGLMGRHRLEFLTTPTGLLLLGLLVREAFSFWTGHPYDFELWIRNGYFVSQGATPYSAYLSSASCLCLSYLLVKLLVV